MKPEDVLVLKRHPRATSPWIGVVTNLVGRRVRYDWLEKDEEDGTWGRNEKYDIADKDIILAIVSSGWSGGSMPQELLKEILELY